ncbi:MAG: glutamate 5-kinase [Planctomycetaceae bacterium]
MFSLARREVVETARTIVIKCGTNVLSRDDDTLDEERIAALVEQVHRIRETGRRVVIVSSGAVGAGMGLLGLKQRPTDLPHLQAAAATGQARLMRVYDDAFRKHGYHAAQMLLTANDFRSRQRYLNVRNTINTLFEFGVVPIVNENDTVSVAEVKFGDNDRLAAMVTNLLEDPLLIILSVTDGLYSGDPRLPESKRIPVVDKWDDTLLGLAANTKSSRGTGGMQMKLQAVRTATAVGECVVIADGRMPQIVDRILDGEDVGTLFLANGPMIPAWKRWIGFTVNPRARIRVDSGAVKALKHDGRSLLPIGISGVEGGFETGELVSIVTPDGEEFARGLSNYDSETVQRIAGKQSADLPAILGTSDSPAAAVVHRDNLCITG